MPMYSFVCRECEKNFERKLPMSQSGDTQDCPSCGSLDTRKTIGSIAINGVSRSTGSTISAPPVSSPFT